MKAPLLLRLPISSRALLAALNPTASGENFDAIGALTVTWSRPALSGAVAIVRFGRGWQQVGNTARACSTAASASAL